MTLSITLAIIAALAFLSLSLIAAWEIWQAKVDERLDGGSDSWMDDGEGN